MADEEIFTLDGLALNDEIAFGLITADIPVPRQRQDWIGAADSEAQLLVRNPLHENRKITLRLEVIQQSTTDLAHDKLVLVLNKLQKASQHTEGITLDWTAAGGTRTGTFTVYAGEITDLPVDWENGWLSRAPSFTVEMTGHPYMLGQEVTTGTTAGIAVFVSMEVANTGDVPGLGRLIVTDTASQSRRHVEWGLEGPLTYNAATSLLLDSDSLVTSGFGGAQSSSTAGAYDPNASGNSSILTTVYNSPQAVCGTGVQSHVGVFRVKARVNNGSLPTGIYWRLAWRVGGGSYTTNDAVSTDIPGWVELDLGTVTVPTVLSGTQAWDGRVEAWKPGSTDTVALDYLILIPVSDGYGKARASYSYTPGVVAGYDNFVGTTATSALGTRTAPAGGSWASSGDTTDFAFADNFSFADGVESITRTTAAVETVGRFAILGSATFTDVEVTANSRVTANAELLPGLIARWTDANNHVRLIVPGGFAATGATGQIGGPTRIEQVVAGTVTVLATSTWQRSFDNRFSYWLRLIVYPSGQAIGHVMDSPGTILAELRGSSAALATSGTLATGKPGLYDRSVSGTSTARYFTAFAVSTPASEPVALYSGRSMQIRHDDVFRQDSTGTYTGRPPSYRGGRFLVPVGTSRVLVKARRNDVESGPDENVTDSTQIQVAYTPRFLAVPR